MEILSYLSYLIVDSTETSAVVMSWVPEIILLLAIWLLARSASAKQIYFWVYAALVAIRSAILLVQVLLLRSNGEGPAFDPTFLFVLTLILSYAAPLCLLLAALKLPRKSSVLESGNV